MTQSSYRVRVTVASGTPVWDSGVVRSNASQVAFPSGAPAQAARPLLPDSEYALAIDVVLSDGSKIVGAGSFRTGLMSASSSAWGGAEWLAGTATLEPARGRRNNLRATWELTADPVSASAFVAGIGYHELYCNGVRQGIHGAKLQPGYTNYEKRTYYIAYNLTRCLKKGANTLGVVLGNGWFSMGALNHTSPYASTMPGSRPVPPQLLLRARATIDYSDEPVLFVSSASSGKWQASSGPIVTDSLYNGESYDARLELIDQHGRHFSHPQYDAASAPGEWSPAVSISWLPNTTLLVPQIMPPIRTIRTIRAVSVRSPVGAPGIWVVDFGQNSAAIVRMKIPRMAAGSSITILHAEALLSDNPVLNGTSPLYSANESGRVYQGNLRTAKATDVYISNGKEAIGTTWEPTFTQHGFRYIEVHGWPAEVGKPSLEDFESLELHSSVTESGSFECSSQLLNQIQANCQWTARSNLMSIPTDCCQRNERRGWMGDAALGASINIFNSDMHSFYSGFADLMTDDQGKAADGDGDGAMPNWIPIFPPSKRHPTKANTGFPGAGAPNWMTAFPTILHTVWKHTGDTRLIKKHWSALKSYVNWLDRKFHAFPDFTSDPFRRTGDGSIATTQFPGDWCPPPAKLGSFYDPELDWMTDSRSGLGEAECGHTGVNPTTGWNVTAALFTDKQLSSAFAYIKDRRNVVEMGAAIDESVSGTDPPLATAFNKAFLSSTGDHYGSAGAATQSENALPLLLGLAPDADTEHRVTQFLLDDIRKHGNHSTSGIVGLRAILEALPMSGHADVALSMLLRTDYPSFGYQAMNTIEPATTIWEVYDAPFEGASMDSRNHVMFATPSYFFFSAVAGFQPVAGDSLWRIAPAVIGASDEVTSATATVWTVKGSLSSAWELHAATPWMLSMNVTVPLGLRVVVAMPTPPVQNECKVTEAGNIIWHDKKFVPGTAAGVVSVKETQTKSRGASIETTMEGGTYGLGMMCSVLR